MSISDEFYAWLERYTGMTKIQFVALTEDERLELVTNFRNDSIMDMD